MTQQGTIKKLLPNGLAEVEVTRRSACGHDCAKCGGCGGLETQTLYVTARNHAHASVGDRVLLEGETRQVLGFAVLVYLLPLVLFFVGYGVGAGMKLGGGLSALIGGVLFAKLMNLFLPQGKKINPMVGGAGISAFPMSARVIQKMALKEDNQNHLLMHAVGANVAGQIGSVVAGGIILTVVPRLIGA